MERKNPLIILVLPVLPVLLILMFLLIPKLRVVVAVDDPRGADPRRDVVLEGVKHQLT